MDFSRSLDDLRSFFETRQFSWAVIGGVALASYGLARMTMDLDIVVDAAAQAELVGYLEKQGFETLHCSAAYSNHLHSDPTRGRIDFVYVRSPTREKLFSGAASLPGPGGREVLVPKPEHLIAMKALAIKNDPDRTLQDLADIRNLARLPGVDHEEIRNQLEKHGLLARYREFDRLL